MATKEKHVAKSNKKSKRKVVDDDKLTLEIVEKLGGSKKDLELLEGIEDVEEFTAPEVDLDADPVNRDNLRDFIENLDIEKYRPKFKPETAEKKKKDESPTEPSIEKEVPVTGKASTKKSKNKFKVQHEEVSSTSPDSGPLLDISFINTYQPRKYLLVKPGGCWLDNLAQNEATEWEPVSDEARTSLEQYASKLLNDDVALYRKQQNAKKSSDANWMRTVLTSGTSSDKLAALTLLLQESHVHNLSHLDTLINMVTKKGHRMTLITLDRLKELFLSDMLPENRKLKTFQQHPHINLEDMCSGNKDTRDKILVMWYFEDQLKQRYAKFVTALQEAARDNIQATKKKAVDAMFELLSERPEQEKMLLTELVNKLGDPDYKVAAQCSHLLIRLVDKHPNMKQVVVLEVERLMYRPNIKPKAQYYAVCFLNQLILSHHEQQLASKLSSIYFSFFKAFVKNKELEKKMMSALLSGVNRAYRFAKQDRVKLEEQVEMMHKVLYSLNFNTSLQALMLLQQITNDGNLSDRYYMALYKKMSDPQLGSSSKHALFLNLLFRSMKSDLSEKRVKAFIKRLLQICCQFPPSFICGALVLLAEVLKEHPGLLNLQAICVDDDDEEEHFVDIPDEEDEKKPDMSEKTEKSSNSTSWLHKSNLNGKKTSLGYDMQQRNPMYSQAEYECMWELKKLTQHYHPSVVLFASTILKGENLSYPGDPLLDFTLIRFLDRFVYRNPKTKQSLPATESGLKFLSRNKRYKAVGVKAIPINSEEYMLTGEENIPADEKYLYKYLSQQAKKSKKSKEDEDSDAGDVSDDEFDSYLDVHEKGLMGEGELDFAGEFGRLKGMNTPRNKKKAKKNYDDEGEDDDVDLSDEEVAFSDDEELRNMFDKEMGDAGMDGESDITFSDDDDEFGQVDFTQGKKGKQKRKHEDDMMIPGKRNKKSSEIMFAAAEEFADLIDKNIGSGFDMTGSDAMSNRDNAHVKQLKWEEERARQLEGKDWRSKRANKSKFKRGKGKFRKPKK